MKNAVTVTKITKAVFSLLFFSIFTFLVFSTSSCHQTIDKEVPIVNNQSKFPLNDIPLETLVKNPNDAEDEYICREHIKMARIVASLITNKEFSKFCMEIAKNNEGEVTYEQIFTKFPLYKPLFANTAIAKRFGMNNGTVSSANIVEGDYDVVHKGFGYNSILFLTNYENAFLTDELAVSPAIEIRDDMENDNHDIIFAWEIQADGSLNEVQIGEKDALNTTIPIFATSLKTMVELDGGNVKVVNSRSPESDRSTGVQTRTTTDCNSHAFQMNVHYENRSGCNEVYASGHQYKEGDFAGSPSINGLANCPSVNNSKKSNFFVAHILYGETGPGQNGPGKIVLSERTFLNYINPTFTHIAYYNTFERDWYARPKPLGSYKFPNDEVYYITGNRVYQEEWMAFNPGPDCGRDPRGTLSHLRNVRIPLLRIKERGEFIEASDEGKGETEFIRRN